MSHIIFKARATFNGTIGSDKWVEGTNIFIAKAGDGKRLHIDGVRCDYKTFTIPELEQARKYKDMYFKVMDKYIELTKNTDNVYWTQKCDLLESENARLKEILDDIDNTLIRNLTPQNKIIKIDEILYNSARGDKWVI